MSFENQTGRKVVVVEGARTPFAKAGADLARLSAVDLGVMALQEAVARSGIDYADIDQIVIGNIGQPADAANVARVISLFAGVPKSVPAFTVQRNCASGMEAVAQAARMIRTGEADVVVAGGTESMTQIPLLLSEPMKSVFMGMAFSKTIGQKLMNLSQLRPSFLKPVVALEVGLTDPVSGMNMGQTAERIARDFGITREEQDEFALQSHHKAIAAREKLKAEIATTYIPPKFKKFLDIDMGPREGQTIEALAKLKPYFDRKHGTVTVGNACPITDGAAMLVLMSEEKARAEGLKILGEIKSVSFAGCEPSRMGLGPVFASPKALKAAGLQMQDMDLVEINEAFAAQVIGCMKAFASKKFCEENFGSSQLIGEIDPAKLNVNGGAIALGHPVGTSGARLILTLLKELERQNKNRGLATLCIGGGQGGACVVERAA
ncbi:MAG: thiolase family protein [Deltaproteobacteria bacterium]|nr:thiolase family protein [Deltaproteobacteria bacterium]